LDILLLELIINCDTTNLLASKHWSCCCHWSLWSENTWPCSSFTLAEETKI